MAASSDSNVKIGLTIEGLQDAAAGLEKLYKLCQGINPNTPTTTTLMNGMGTATNSEGGSHPGIQHSGGFDLKSADAMAQRDVDTLLGGQPLYPGGRQANPASMDIDHAAEAQRNGYASAERPSLGATVVGEGASQAIGRFAPVIDVRVISMPRVEIGNWPEGGGGGGSWGGHNSGGSFGPGQPSFGHPAPPHPQNANPNVVPINPDPKDPGGVKGLHRGEAYGQSQVIEDLTKDIKSAPIRTLAEEFLTGTRGGNYLLRDMGVVHDAAPALFDGAMKVAGKALPFMAGVGLVAEGVEKLADGYNTFTARNFEIDKENAGKRAAGITIDPFNEAIDRKMANRDRFGDMSKKYMSSIPIVGGAVNAVLEGTWYRDLDMKDEEDRGMKIRHGASQQFAALTGENPFSLTDDTKTAAVGAAGLASALGGLAPLNGKWAKEYSKESYNNYLAGGYSVDSVNNSFGVLAGVLSSNSFVAQQKQMLSGAKNPMDFAKMGMETLALRGDTAGVQAMSILLDKPATDKHAEELKALGFKENETLEEARKRHQITTELPGPGYGSPMAILQSLVTNKPRDTVTETDPAWLAKYENIQNKYLADLAVVQKDTVKALATAVTIKSFELAIGIDQAKSSGAYSDINRMKADGANLSDIAKFQKGELSSGLRDELQQNLGELAALKAKPNADKQAIANAEAKVKGDRSQIATNNQAAQDSLNQKEDIQNATASMIAGTQLDTAMNAGGGNNGAIQNAFGAKAAAQVLQRNALLAKSKQVDRYDADTRAGFAAQAGQLDYQINIADKKQEYAFFDSQQQSATAVSGSIASQRQTGARLYGSIADMRDADLGAANVIKQNMADTTDQLNHARQVGSQEDVNRLTAQYNSQLTQLISATTQAARSFQDAGIALNQIKESAASAVIARDNIVGSTFSQRQKHINDSIAINTDIMKTYQDEADGKTGIDDITGAAINGNPLLAGGNLPAGRAGKSGGAGGATSTAHGGKGGSEKESAIAVRIVASIPLEFSGSGHGGGHGSGHGGGHHPAHSAHQGHHATHGKAHGGAHHGAMPGEMHPDVGVTGGYIGPDGVMHLPKQVEDSDRRQRAKAGVEEQRNKILASIDSIANSPQDVKDRLEQTELDTRRMISRGTFSSQGNLLKQDYEEIGLIGKREKFQQMTNAAALTELQKNKGLYSAEDYQSEVDKLNLNRADAKKQNVSSAMSAFGDIQQQQQGAFLMNIMNAPGRFSAVASQFTRLEAAPMMQAFGPSWGFTEKKERDDWMFAGSRMRENFGVNGVTGGDMNPNHAEGFFNQTMMKAGLAGAGNPVMGMTPSAMIENMMGGMPARTLSKDAPAPPVRVELVIKNDGSISSGGQTITRGQSGVIHAVNNTVTSKDVPARGASRQ